MRIIVLISLVFFICNSCKKNKNIGSLYDSFVGKWQPENNEEEGYIEFKKNGIINYDRGIEHQLNLNIDVVNEDDPALVDGKLWNVARFVQDGKKGNYNNFVVFYNEAIDTILKYKSLIDSTGNYNTVTIEKLYFVRQ